MRSSPTSIRCLSLFVMATLGVAACGEDEPVEHNVTTDGADPTDGATDGTDESDVMRPGTGGTTTTPPTIPTTPPSGGSSPFGRSCDIDGDCAPGLRCMEVDSGEWLGGGPAHGYCTADCSADPGICFDADPSSLCVQFDGPEPKAMCMQGCGLGPVQKCQNRADVACDVFSLNGYGFCRPMCRSDADCDGLSCDVGSGSCVEELPEGDPIGAECDPDAAVSTCQSGFCLPFTEEYAFCTGWCTLGTIGCGSDSTMPEDPGEPLCTWPLASGSDFGDLGLCHQRCDCDDDCLHPDFRCLIVSDDFAEVLGTAGLCVEPEYDAEADTTAVALGRECSGGGGGDGGAGDAGPMSPMTDASTTPPEADDAATPSPPVEASAPETPLDASGDR